MDEEAKLRRRAAYIASRDASYADAAERIRIQGNLADKLLGALLIAHGGGIIGLFTFAGNLLGKKGIGLHIDPTLLWLAFGLFALGLGLALLAYLFAFMSQDAYYRQAMSEVQRLDRTIITDSTQTDQRGEIKHFLRGNGHFAFGLAVAGTSIVLFIGGSFAALAGLLPN